MCFLCRVAYLISRSKIKVARLNVPNHWSTSEPPSELFSNGCQKGLQFHKSSNCENAVVQANVAKHSQEVYTLPSIQFILCKTFAYVFTKLEQLQPYCTSVPVRTVVFPLHTKTRTDVLYIQNPVLNVSTYKYLHVFKPKNNTRDRRSSLQLSNHIL